MYIHTSFHIEFISSPKPLCLSDVFFLSHSMYTRVSVPSFSLFDFFFVLTRSPICKDRITLLAGFLITQEAL